MYYRNAEFHYNVVFMSNLNWFQWEVYIVIIQRSRAENWVQTLHVMFLLSLAAAPLELMINPNNIFFWIVNNSDRSEILWANWIVCMVHRLRFFFLDSSQFRCVLMWLYECCSSSHLKCVRTIKSIHLLTLQHYRTAIWIYVHVVSICLDEMKTNHNRKMQTSIENVHAARTRLSQNIV